MPNSSSIELSVVLPCLNEADTLEICLRKAFQAIHENQLDAEVIVADNGSTDGSIQIAKRCGARVVSVEAPGYGHALIGGICASEGKYILMADADDSYDLLELPKFVFKLREGFDLVQGCRLPSGGGRIAPGAMPFLHRWWGNPMFTWMSRRFFQAPIHDVYCGMRAFAKSFYQGLDLGCTGMEFATEMIIKSSMRRARIAEVPITLHRDGRKSHAPHLKTFRDGWRTLRFFLIYAPRWLFLIPGEILILLGLGGYILALPNLQIGGVAFDAHTLLFSTLFILCGYQSILFAIFTKIFAIREGFLAEGTNMARFMKHATLERGLIAGGVSIVIGIVLLAIAVNRWRLTDFGHLDYSQTMRLVIPGTLFTMGGVLTVFASFFISLLLFQRKPGSAK